MVQTALLRLIDKEISPPQGTVDLPASITGTTDGDLLPFQGAVEFTHTSVKKISSIIVKIPVKQDGLFVTKPPFLIDENTKVKYLIEFQITQGANIGKLFRGEIGIPSLVEDENLGWILSIPCEAISRTIREIPQSLRGVLKTPKQRFIDAILEYDEADPGNIITFKRANPNVSILLPEKSQTKQFWDLVGPTKTQGVLNEVIERLEQAPQAGGKLLDFYYDFDPSLTNTRRTDVFAEEFGLNDSGVVIDPLTVDDGANTQKRIENDNITFKNLIVARGDPNSGTVPANMQRFRSEYLHALARDLWDDNSISYEEGDVVRREFPNTFPDQRFFTAKTDHTSSVGNPPETSPILWDEDFSIDPSNPVFFSPTPWTSSLEDFRQNIVGKGNSGIAGYEGFFFDWNIERTLYDRPVSNNPFQRLSVKQVEKRTNIPPLRAETYDGYRVIIGVSGSIAIDIGPGVEGFDKDPEGNSVWISANRGRIAEYFGRPLSVGFGSGWIISDEPIDQGVGEDREQDTVNDNETAKVLKWDNGALGDWVDAWDIVTDSDKSSPYHLVRSTKLVDGATGLPNQAFEASFDFKESILPPPLGDPSFDFKNRNSRGVWLSFIDPYPHITTGNGVGNLCGGNAEFPYFDTFNLDRTCDGSRGWNQGVKSEELGRVNGIHFKLKIAFFLNSEETSLALGFANIPMVFWAMDKFGRVYYQDFAHPKNGSWNEYTIQFGSKSPQQYFFSRFEEIASSFGYKLPFNFNLKEREYTGIHFDWRFVKYWGIFSKYMYEENAGFYLGAINSIYKSFVEGVEQIGHKVLQIAELIVSGSTQVPLVAEFVPDHATIAIDEVYYVKEMYALSEDVPVVDPRIEIIDDRAERDYITLRSKAKAKEARKKFFPQFWHMTAKGDVRMKFGEKFTASGSRVPGGTQELVCAEVKHILNDDGYFMEIFGVRKFIAE